MENAEYCMTEQLLPSETKVNDSIPFDWDTFLPFELFYFKKLLLCIESRALQWAYVIFAIFVVGAMITILLTEWKSGHLNNSIETILFYVLFTLTALAYIFLPPVYMLYLKDIVECQHMNELFSESVRMDCNFKTRCQIICHTNFIMVFVTVILHSATYDMPWYLRVVSVFVAPVYTFPNVMAFTTCVMVLDAHRVQIQQFLEVLDGCLTFTKPALYPPLSLTEHCHSTHQSPRGGTACADEIHMNRASGSPPTDGSSSGEQPCGPSGRSTSGDSVPMSVLWVRYYELHSVCRHTSRQWGKMMVLLSVVSFLIVASTVWDIARHMYPKASLLGYSIYSIVLLHEFMFVLVMTNETGHLLCNRLSSIGMGRMLSLGWKGGSAEGVPALGARDEDIVPALVGCLSFVKVQVTFQGEFALRSRMLIAIIGSIVGAVLSAVFL